MPDNFSFSTIEHFDDHINKSIRGYEDLVADVESMGEYFIKPNTDVIDIGCSTGKLLSRMAEHSKLSNVNFIGIEKEKNFWPDMEKIKTEKMTFFNSDIEDYTFSSNNGRRISFAQSIFTLQFLDPKVRDIVVQKMYNSMIDGAGFVSAEKVYSTCAKVQDMKTSLYYEYKNRYFSYEEIFEKEKSLRSMMTLKNLNEIIKYYYEIGFSSVETFWQSHNFVAVICIK